MRFHWSALLVTLVLSSLPSGFSHAQTPAQAPNVSGQGPAAGRIRTGMGVRAARSPSICARTMRGTRSILSGEHDWYGCGEFRNWTNHASQNRNPKSRIGPAVQSNISDFGFEMQDSSNFKIPRFVPVVNRQAGPPARLPARSACARHRPWRQR